MPQPSLIICPNCNGHRFFKGIACSRGTKNGSYSTTFEIACILCKGEGSIDQATFNRFDAAKLMRKTRVDAGRSLKDEAARLGITTQELSKIERGY